MSVVPATAPERVIARIRAHARALVFPTLVLVLVCAALGYLSGLLTEAWQSLAALGIGALLVIVGWFVPLVGWLSRTTTVTTRRTVLRSGVFVRSRQEVLHSRVVEVTVRKGALQSMFGSGDVLIGVGTARPIVLRDVPSPDLVADAIHELMEQARPDWEFGSVR